MCDLFLDTPAFVAHTTGSDALWAGLPFVTIAGLMVMVMVIVIVMAISYLRQRILIILDMK